MAHPNTALIEGLRKAAASLVKGNYYAWGHHGACNCGHLCRQLPNYQKKNISPMPIPALANGRSWRRKTCAVTNAPVNLLLKKLEELGLTPTDIHNIEYLEDSEVLHRRLPEGF